MSGKETRRKDGAGEDGGGTEGEGKGEWSESFERAASFERTVASDKNRIAEVKE